LQLKTNKKPQVTVLPNNNNNNNSNPNLSNIKILNNNNSLSFKQLNPNKLHLLTIYYNKTTRPIMFIKIYYNNNRLLINFNLITPNNLNKLLRHLHLIRLQLLSQNNMTNPHKYKIIIMSMEWHFKQMHHKSHVFQTMI
jgi:hypothetical protein